MNHTCIDAQVRKLSHSQLNQALLTRVTCSTIGSGSTGADSFSQTEEQHYLSPQGEPEQHF